MENQVHGEETKYKSFAVKDTAKERYHKHCKLVEITLGDVSNSKIVSLEHR
jgi:hypothetical protein